MHLESHKEHPGQEREQTGGMLRDKKWLFQKVKDVQAQDAKLYKSQEAKLQRINISGTWE